MKIYIDQDEFKTIITELLGINKFNDEMLDIIYEDMDDDLTLNEIEYYLNQYKIMDSEYMTISEFQDTLSFLGHWVDEVINLGDYYMCIVRM